MSSSLFPDFVSFSPPHTMQIDPFDDHDQLLVGKRQPFGRCDRIRRRRLKPASFQSLVHYPETMAIKH